MKRLTATLALFYVVGFAVLPHSYGQDQAQGSLAADMVSVFKEPLEKQRTMVNEWQAQAKIIISLTALVGILGVVTGLLQGSTKTWAKPATVIVGAMVSIITIINNTYFGVDYRLLQAKAREVNSKIRGIELDIKKVEKGLYNTESPDDLNKILDGINNRLDDIDSLADRLASALFTPAAGITFTSEAYAQSTASSLPRWINQAPKSDRFLYYVGEGKGEKLHVAQANALVNAHEQLGSYAESYALGKYKDQAKRKMIEEIVLPEVLEFVLRDPITVVEDEYFAYNPKTKKYHYFVLSRTNREALSRRIEVDIRLQQLKTSGKTPG